MIPKKYMAAVNALYGVLDQGNTVAAPPPRSRRKRAARCLKTDVPKESGEQIAVVDWLVQRKVNYYSIPNEGQRSMGYAAKLGRMGLQSGVPDLCIPYRRGVYGACYVELKRKKGGKLSDAQKEFIGKLLTCGNFVYIAAGAEIAIKIIEDYLRGNPVKTNYEDWL